MKLVYDINDRPPLKKNLIFALQQLLAIMAATLLVPVLVNNNTNSTYMSQPAALLGAGCGTLFYVLMTKGKSPVFLGSSFAFIAPLCGAVSFGYLGIFLGAVFAGLVYVILAVVIKFTGSNWINKLMPPVVIGPTVALIGLSLCGSAVNNIANLNFNETILNLKAFAGGELNVSQFLSGKTVYEGVENISTNFYSLWYILVAVIAFFITVYASTKGTKGMKLIPFVIGILGAYAIACVLTLIGKWTNYEAMQIVDFSKFNNVKVFDLPEFTFLGMFEEGTSKFNGFATVIEILLLFAPVALVVLAEHIADHKNLSSIIDRDLITEPGLHRTLIGDGVGSMIGSFFGGCPNTTYGESVGCVAITGNASISTIVIAALYCIVLAFFGPFTAFVNSIPTCITGGVCIALYGFIAVSGLKMVQKVDLNDNRNLFVVAAILVTGIGGLTLNFGPITISSIATALILGILVNVIFNRRKGEEKAADAE